MTSMKFRFARGAQAIILALLAAGCASRYDAAGTGYARRQSPQQVMAELDEQGYFARCRSGEMRGCSYFARLVAQRLNPTGSCDGFGALTKPAGGSNVEGYADDAIVLGCSSGNLQNVYDLVTSAGAPGASIGFNGPLPRRSSDLWEAPNRNPLTSAQLEYLRPGGGQPGPGPGPGPGPIPTPTPDLQKVLDAIAVVAAQNAALSRQVDAQAVILEGVKGEAVAAKDAATRAQGASDAARQAIGDVVTRVDRMHQDVLIAIDLGRQNLALTYSGRVPAFGGAVTLTPNRP